MRLPRRAFLQLAGAAASAACGPPPRLDGPTRPTVDPDAHDDGRVVAFDVGAFAVDESVFPRGVSAGAMKPTSTIVWTFVADGAPTTLRVWRDAADDGDVVLVHEAEVAPADGGFVKVVVDGLAPATWYRYAFFRDADERRSLDGRVRTAFPDDWVWPVKITATTCTSFDEAPYRALQRAADEDVDVLVHLGDMVYADGSTTIDEYRDAWRRTLEDPGYRALLPRQGLYMTWDDHEFTNNLDPETIDPALLETAKQAFFETLPLERVDGDHLWTSYRWGRSVEFIVLDCRTERRPSTLGTDQTVYMSDAQKEFFLDRLKNSPCRFKVVLNSVPMTKMPEPLWALAGDRWQGYASAREEILSFIEREGVRGVWFLSGDFHVGFVSRLEADGPRRGLREVAVGPGGNLGNPLGFLAEQEEYREEVFPAAQFAYGKGALAATTIWFDPLTDSVRVVFRDVDGAVLFDERFTDGA